MLSVIFSLDLLIQSVISNLDMIYYMVTVWSTILLRWKTLWRCVHLWSSCVDSLAQYCCVVEIAIFHAETTILPRVNLFGALLIRIKPVSSAISVICLFNHRWKSPLKPHIILKWIWFLWAMLSWHMGQLGHLRWVHHRRRNACVRILAIWWLSKLALLTLNIHWALVILHKWWITVICRDTL